MPICLLSQTASSDLLIETQAMTVSIAKISSPKADEWDLIWSQCPYSTYFHSREWAEIWKGYTTGAIRPDPKLMFFCDGKKALLPLSSRRTHRGFFKHYELSPAGTFGGWISLDDLTTLHATLLTDYLTKRLGSLIWRLNPYDQLLSKSGVTSAEDDVTHTLNLEQGFDSIYRAWTKGHRSAARKAQREGVIVKVASTLEDWCAYYRVYQDSLRRWGLKATSNYGWSFFQELFERASPYIKLWLAIYQDTVVAGALTFYAKHHVVYWHGAALEAYLNLRPVHLVLFHAIKDACERRFSWFDFNPSGGHHGVRHFKESFGTQSLSCPVFYGKRTIVDYIKQLRSACHL